MLGARVGPYEVTAALGAGAMGEVYRARDPRLGREVAIKILPDLFAGDPERRARFEREARTLAALNHPHIAQIYGVEETAGGPALVMELVEGETLDERLRGRGPGRGVRPLPVGEALGIARQVAEALEAAHEAGIVHRDLKPANIKVRPDGTVKVLDFGLAKVAGPAESSPADSVDATATSPLETRRGVVVGTAATMSPEQARGLAVDRRSDLWALGCVVYEMLTGRSAFAGETVADTLAAVLERQPDWEALPAATPAPVRRLLRRCLEKDPRRRWRDAGDARIVLEEALAGGPEPAAAAIAAPSRAARLRRWGLAAAVLLLAAAAAAWHLHRSDPSWSNPIAGAQFARLTDFDGAERHAAISRDGKFVAFLSDRDGPVDVWVGQVPTGEFHNLTRGLAPELGNDEIRNLTFSPDGSLVLVWVRPTDAEGAPLPPAIWAVPTLGGRLRPYSAAVELDWSPDGTRLAYHTPAAGDPIFVTEPGEGLAGGREIFAGEPGLHNHHPVWSPDGAFIYFVHGFPPGETDIWRIRATGGEPQRITFHDSTVSHPTPLDDRTLLYLATAEDGSGPWIYGVDLRRRVARRVSFGLEQYTSLAATADRRRLVTTVANPGATVWRVPIADGVVEEEDATRFALPTTRGFSPRLGPGYLLFLSSKGGPEGLWKLEDGVATELWSGLDGRVAAAPAVSPDGRHIAFPVSRSGRATLYLMNADGTGARRLAEALDVRGAPGWSPDGRSIAVAGDRGDGLQLFTLPVEGGAPVSIVDAHATDPVWSPDGRILAFAGPQVGPAFPVQAVAVSGELARWPKLTLPRGVRGPSGRFAFLPGREALVVLEGELWHQNFWLIDLEAGIRRQLTDFERRFRIGSFDISADGREIVFDRIQDSSDVVLIDLAER